MTSSPLVSRANMDILDELQLIAAQNLERLEVNKYYEVIRELGKGTYGKVDLVIHKIRGEQKQIIKINNDLCGYILLEASTFPYESTILHFSATQKAQKWP